MHAIWFRNDLRVAANPALNAAIASGKPLVGLYFFTPDQHQQHDVGPTKLRFITESVAALATDLKKKQIPLLAIKCSDFADSVNQLLMTCRKHRIQQLYANEETELNERQRDQSAHKLLAKHNIGLQFSQDQTLCAPGSILTNEGQPYRVFSPFKRAFLKTIQQQALKPTTKRYQESSPSIETSTQDSILGWCDATPANAHWPAGADEAQRRLRHFIQEGIKDYKDQRDIPATTGTSQLSPYLAVGAISVEQCAQAALEANNYEWSAGNAGIQTWLSELIWREFYKHLSQQHPALSKGANFQAHTQALRWRQDQDLFQHWCQGTTGYPMVDAGMRQLNSIGWMHNRLRMVTAMFLTKHLFIDWHWGERYFMQQLIDSDYAANNGGWQWSASTGADGAPYFRIFNPERQSQRFDPSGTFIREWVPELRDLSDREIHSPSDKVRAHTGYPSPIVEHAKAVAYAKQQFQSLSN